MPCLLLASLLWFVAPAALAHAVLLGSEPAADAELAEAPGEVVLRFNEPISLVTVRLLDATGTAVGSEPVARDDSVILPLPPLADGSYIVTWRVISTDSHPVGGSFRFSIGAPLDTEAAPKVAEADWRGAAALHRAAWLALMLLGTGSAAFVAAFGGPPSRATVPLLLAAAAFALGLVPIQGGLRLGLPPGDVSFGDLVASGLFTPAGRFGLVAAGLLLLAALLVLRRPVPATVAALAAVAALGLSGHAATAEPRWITGPALALHAALAALWAGALLPLRASLTRLPQREAAALLVAFSRRAVPSVAALVIAGGVLAVIQVRGPEGFLTPYGAVLALKLAGVALLLGIALWNRNRLTPALAAGAPGAAPRLRRSIGIEIAVMLSVVASVAALAQLTPPRALLAQDLREHDHHHEQEHEHHKEHEHHRHEPLPDRPTVWLEDEAGGYRMSAGVVAAPDGAREIVATFTDALSAAVEPLEVEAAFASPEHAIEPVNRPMEWDGEAWTLRTRDIALPGLWRIEVIVLVSDFERVRFTAEVSVE
jgi:copper transport protein